MRAVRTIRSVAMALASVATAMAALVFAIAMLPEMAVASGTDEAYAMYDTVAHSLTFERGSVPVQTATTKVYTGFEDGEYYFDTTPWAGVARSVETVTFKDTIKPKSTAYWFSDFRNAIDFDLKNLDTSQVTDMEGMFKICQRLNTIDVSSLDTGNVTTMESMFDGCTNLGYLDATTWDTSNVRNMYAMFLNCPSLTYFDMSHWDTGRCENMGVMFSDADHLCSINLSGVNTSSVKTMHLMFFGCFQLTDLDLSSFTSEQIYGTGDNGYSGEYSFFGYDYSEREGWTRRLQRVTLNDSYSTFADFTFPVQTPDMVADADGSWYDIQGNAYKGQVPSKAGRTYYGSSTMAAKTDIAAAEVAVSQGVVAATGAELQPSVTVTLEGRQLQQGADYSVTYFNNVYSGVATAAVYGMGTYRGVALGYFTVTGLQRPAGKDFNPQPVTPTPLKVLPSKVTVGNIVYKLNVAKGTAQVVGLSAKGKKMKTLSVAAVVTGAGWSCKVTGIAARAFAGSKAVKLKVATKKLTKRSVKRSLKGSKIKTVKVAVGGGKKINRLYVKTYKKCFSSSNCGKAVKVR